MRHPASFPVLEDSHQWGKPTTKPIITHCYGCYEVTKGSEYLDGNTGMKEDFLFGMVIRNNFSEAVILKLRMEFWEVTSVKRWSKSVRDREHSFCKGPGLRTWYDRKAAKLFMWLSEGMWVIGSKIRREGGSRRKLDPLGYHEAFICTFLGRRVVSHTKYFILDTWEVDPWGY